MSQDCWLQLDYPVLFFMASSMLFVIGMDPQITCLYWYIIGKALMLCTQKPYQTKGLYHLFWESNIFTYSNFYMLIAYLELY